MFVELQQKQTLGVVMQCKDTMQMHKSKKKEAYSTIYLYFLTDNKIYVQCISIVLFKHEYKLSFLQ